MKNTFKDSQNVYSIISDLIKDGNNVGEKENLAFGLAMGEMIIKSLKFWGLAEDETFEAKCKEIEQQARRVKLELIDSPENSEIDEWQFYPIMITAPEPLMSIIDNIMETHAKSGKGIFSNVTDIVKEDEDEDELLIIEVFGLQCSLVPYLDELKKYKVVNSILNDEFKKLLLAILKNETTFIRDNTDAPAKVKNHISNTIIELDKIPIWGLIFQILILQGLCRWLEGININEGDNGYNETQSLYNWMSEQLAKKLVSFCCTPYGDRDKERLKPLCNYLYSTELGRMVQEILFKKKQPKPIHLQEAKQQQVSNNDCYNTSAPETTNREEQNKNNKVIQKHLTPTNLTEKELQNLFNRLKSGGFLLQTTLFSHFCYVFGGTSIPEHETPFIPLQWTAINKKTKGKRIENPDKVSVLDFLDILGYSDDVIKNRLLLNTLFIFSNGNSLSPQNYTDITTKKGILKRPLGKEYHDELIDIVNNSREK